jgi:hypothetical protein
LCDCANASNSASNARRSIKPVKTLVSWSLTRGL